MPAELSIISVPNSDGLVSRDAADDYEFSRKKYRELIGKASEAIDKALQLALESEHPKAFESFSAMMTATAEMTDRLMELQHSKAKLEQIKPEKESERMAIENGSKTQSISQTNVFVGSPAELQKMLRQKMNDIVTMNIPSALPTIELTEHEKPVTTES